MWLAADTRPQGHQAMAPLHYGSHLTEDLEKSSTGGVRIVMWLVTSYLIQSNRVSATKGVIH